MFSCLPPGDSVTGCRFPRCCRPQLTAFQGKRHNDGDPNLTEPSTLKPANFPGINEGRTSNSSKAPKFHQIPSILGSPKSSSARGVSSLNSKRSLTNQGFQTFILSRSPCAMVKVVAFYWGLERPPTFNDGILISNGTL